MSHFSTQLAAADDPLLLLKLEERKLAQAVRSRIAKLLHNAQQEAAKAEPPRIDAPCDGDRALPATTLPAKAAHAHDPIAAPAIATPAIAIAPAGDAWSVASAASGGEMSPREREVAKDLDILGESLITLDDRGLADDCVRQLVQINRRRALKALHADPTGEIQSALIDIISVGNVAVRLALEMRVEALRAELTTPQAPPLERLLIEQVIICWLQVQQTEKAFLSQRDAPDPSMRLKNTLRDSSHKRLNSAVKTLTTLRRLNIQLNVNIAEKQINFS